MATVRWLTLIIALCGVSALIAWEIKLRSDPEIDEAAADQLANTADRWCAEFPNGRDVPQTDWPAEIKQLKPISVRVSTEGVFVKLRTQFVEDYGVFILRGDSTFQPSRRTDPSFRLLRGRVYWYEIKG